jgi:hypothetical protein
MAARESIEKTDIRNPNATMSEPAKVQTAAGVASIKVVMGYNRTIKVRVSGKGIRNG